MEEIIKTPFSVIYDSFLSKITDDMYMELNQTDTEKLLKQLLMTAIYKFEFPRKNLEDFELENNDSEEEALAERGGFFNSLLTGEEVNILATYMIVEWIGQQLASVENTRMKYSGSDFKFTSQANHMQKLLTIKKDYEREGFHLQRLYKRREKDEKGINRSTLDQIVAPIDRRD